MTRHTDDELCAALRYEAKIKRKHPKHMDHIADLFDEAAERIEELARDLDDALDDASELAAALRRGETA